MSKESKSVMPEFPPPQLNEQSVRKIGTKLREQFDEVISEPIPDRFSDLLNQLEQSTDDGSDALND